MTRTDEQYLDELTLHLRFADLSGADIGEVLEEVRDHLAHVDEPAEATFGPVADYARRIVEARGRSPASSLGLSRGDLLAAALQILGWYGLIYGGIAALGGDRLGLTAGHLAGAAVLAAGLVWPVWPALRANATGGATWLLPAAASTATVAVSVVLVTWLAQPVLLSVPPVPAIGAALVVIAGCWARAFRRRDPVRRPGWD